MQIIITIPDEKYEEVKKAGGCYYDFGKAIYNGKPLPKMDKEDVQNVINSMTKEQQDVLYYLVGETAFMYDKEVD